MRITIIGAGNIGTQFAVHCAEKGHDVTIYTSNPEIIKEELTIVDDEGLITHKGKIYRATNDPKTAFENSDFIMVTFPANLMQDIARIVYTHSTSKAIIGVVPGNGGSECAFKKCIERGNTFFLLERVPAIARLVKKGERVKSTGYRSELHVSSLPIEKGVECAELISSIFDIKCVVIPGILNLTLTPSNPILHTTRLKSLFSDYKKGVTYDYIPLFYEEWDIKSSELLLACDDEVQQICKALPDHNLKFVKSLKEHYESPTAEALTEKIKSIKAFKGIVTPSIKIGDKYIPDLHSRYFTADFSYGLTIIKQVAEFADVMVPNIDSVLNWYNSISIEKNEFSYKDYGITDRETFDMFYLR